MSAREEVLARVRSALADARPAAGAGAEAEVTDRGYRQSVPLDDVVGLFAERVADYRAVVVRCSPEEVPAAIAAALGGAQRVLVPAGFPDELLGGGPQDTGLPGGAARVDDSGLSAAELDRVDAVVTTAAVGIALTGTIVLDHGPGQGRRAATLVPDLHVCVVRAGQVVDSVPAAVARLDPARPQTWVSGPSATSDIELDRVEGVHGPRNLHVIVVG